MLIKLIYLMKYMIKDLNLDDKEFKMIIIVNLKLWNDLELNLRFNWTKFKIQENMI